MNRSEALDQEAEFLAAGHQIVSISGDTLPDLIVVRGCSVTAKAERECRKAIDRLRARFPLARISVAGCLAGVSKEDNTKSIEGPVPLRTARAYLKIQDGCSGKCAFCIVPSFRGPPRSVPFQAVLARARAFLAAGYRELVVTGCNLALYRDSGIGLADVLTALARLDSPSSHRVRIGSLEPGICDGAVLDALAANSNICPFLHLSVQSGSDTVLARMNRPYRLAAVERLCATAIERLGGRLALGADFIAGFPGETDADFAATEALTERFPFSNLHVFPYSERPGTAAATMDGSVPPGTRRQRAERLMSAGKRMRAKFAASFAGQTVEVCMEKPKRGWTAEYLACQLAPGSGTFPRRTLVATRVLRAEGDLLIAEPIARE